MLLTADADRGRLLLYLSLLLELGGAGLVSLDLGLLLLEVGLGDLDVLLRRDAPARSISYIRMLYMVIDDLRLAGHCCWWVSGVGDVSDAGLREARDTNSKCAPRF